MSPYCTIYSNFEPVLLKKEYAGFLERNNLKENEGKVEEMKLGLEKLRGAIRLSGFMVV